VSKLISIVVIILMLLIILTYAVAVLNDKATRREYARAAAIEADGRARALVIAAQAESRLHAAQASATLSAVLLPWGILAVLGLLGLAIITLAGTVLILYLLRPPQSVQIIERRVLYLPAPGQRRSEVWQALCEYYHEDPPRLIQSGSRKTANRS
jgi:hypothetical protein